jgi:hypothetical protein
MGRTNVAIILDLKDAGKEMIRTDTLLERAICTR